MNELNARDSALVWLLESATMDARKTLTIRAHAADLGAAVQDEAATEPPVARIAAALERVACALEALGKRPGGPGFWS
jgi:hypothetical protein